MCLFKQGWEAKNTAVPLRAKEIMDRMGNLRLEMRRLEKELKRLPDSEDEGMEESRIACPRLFNCKIEFPGNPDTAETPRIHWTPSRPLKGLVDAL